MEATLNTAARKKILDGFFKRGPEYYWSRLDVESWTMKDLHNLIIDELKREEPRATALDLLYKRYAAKRRLQELSNVQECLDGSRSPTRWAR